MLLSIGIIAKNEERYIDGCLKSIKPLLDTGKAELIFVDTGSTDKTVEIASKYTDKIYYFEWINDFSAARNETIKYSTGDWYMYIDADEAFDSESPKRILEFLDSKEASSYSAISLHEKNFVDMSYTSYTEFIPTRIFKKTDDLHFENKIHECINVDGFVKIIPAVLLHYGYADEVVNKEKENRNIDILKDYYLKSPQDPKILMYLHNSSNNNDDKSKYLNEWLALVESDNKDHLNELCFLTAAQFYFAQKEYEKAIKYSDMLLSLSGALKRLSSVAGYFIMADSYASTENYKKASRAYKQYYDKYDEYLTGKLSSDNLGVINGIQVVDYESRKFIWARCLVVLGKLDDAIKAIKNVDYSTLSNEHMNLASNTYIMLVTSGADFSKYEKQFMGYLQYISINYPAELQKFATLGL